MSSYRVRWTNSTFVYQSSFTSIVSDSQVLLKLLPPALYSSACSVAVWSSVAVVSWPWTFSFLPPLPAAKYLFTTGQSNRERAVGRSSGRSYNKQHHVSVTDAFTRAFHGQIQLFGETFTRLQCSLQKCHLILASHPRSHTLHKQSMGSSIPNSL